MHQSPFDASTTTVFAPESIADWSAAVTLVASYPKSAAFTVPEALHFAAKKPKNPKRNIDFPIISDFLSSDGKIYLTTIRNPTGTIRIE
jgi:hypothetical protein